MSYKSNLEKLETLDGLANKNFYVRAMMANNGKILGWNCLDVTCRVRPNNADVAAPSPDVQRIRDSEFESEPNKAMIIMPLSQRPPSLSIRSPAAICITRVLG